MSVILLWKEGFCCERIHKGINGLDLWCYDFNHFSADVFPSSWYGFGLEYVCVVGHTTMRSLDLLSFYKSVYVMYPVGPLALVAREKS